MKKKRIKSFGFAIEGLIEAFRTQWNFKFHCLAAILVVIAGFYLKVSSFEWVYLVFAIGFVLTTELVNTAIEYSVNLATSDIHPLAKSAKDVAAGAVLVSSISAAIVGAIVLGPKLLEQLQ